MTREEWELEARKSECRAEAEQAHNREKSIMKDSGETAALATALSAFTGEIEDAKKESTAHAYKYADLPTLLQLARPLLHKHGLAVAQFPINNGEQIGVMTRLMHNSGEWIESPFTVPATTMRGMNDVQAVGSTLTYLRRYAFAAALGISQVDDDAHAAQTPQLKPVNNSLEDIGI